MKWIAILLTLLLLVGCCQAEELTREDFRLLKGKLDKVSKDIDEINERLERISKILDELREVQVTRQKTQESARPDRSERPGPEWQWDEQGKYWWRWADRTVGSIPMTSSVPYSSVVSAPVFTPSYAVSSYSGPSYSSYQPVTSSRPAYSPTYSQAYRPAYRSYGGYSGYSGYSGGYSSGRSGSC